jgi:hypothetical protein
MTSSPLSLSGMPPSNTSSTWLLLHRRHIFSKIYINVVFIDIFVNTSLPHNIVT